MIVSLTVLRLLKKGISFDFTCKVNVRTMLHETPEKADDLHFVFINCHNLCVIFSRTLEFFLKNLVKTTWVCVEVVPS